MRVLVAGLAMITMSSAAFAQESGPRRGSWGVEGISGASLLRFRSPASAWVLNANAQFSREDREPDSSPPFTGDETIFLGDLRLGLRRYRQAEARVRPYTTVSAVIGYNDLFAEKGWEFGAAVEGGSAYFFLPNLSLGAAADLSAMYGKRDRELTTQEITTISVRFSGFRIVGALYF